MLARWLLPATVRRYRVPLIFAAVGTAVFGTVLPFIASTADSAASDVNGLGSAALRAIEVAGYDASDRTPPLTREVVDGFLTVPHVDAAYPWVMDGIMVNVPNGEAESLSFVPRWPDLQPRLVSGAEPVALDEILVPQSFAEKQAITPGDRVTVEHTRRQAGSDTGQGVETVGVVSGTYDDTVPGIDGPGVAYATLDAVVATIADGLGHDPGWMAANYRFPKAYVIVDDTSNTTAVVRSIADQGFVSSSLTSLLSAIPMTQQFLDALRPILTAVLAVLLAVVGWSIAGSAVAARRPEVGVLRALGWSRGEVVRTFAVQFAATGLLVGGVGGALSLLMVTAAGAAGPGVELLGMPLGGRANVDLLTLAALVVAPAVVFLVAGTLPIVRAARIPPDDVLRSIA